MRQPRLVLLDRDGVLNMDKGYLYRKQDLEWVPGSREALKELAEAGIPVAVVTNQSGVARGYYGEKDVLLLHSWMVAQIRKAGGDIARFYYCPHHKEGKVAEYAVDCDCRKPKPGMVLRALEELFVAPEDAILIGDSPRDVEAAEAAGVTGYLFQGGDLREFLHGILDGSVKPGV